MEKTDLEEIQGQLERVTYFNADSHYTVARLKVKGRPNLVTVVGNLVSVSPGETLSLRGSWTVHPKYGEQFRIVSYETVVPATADGIRKYLGSGMIRGIGPVMAKRLVDRFGEETLEIIEHDTGRLCEVEGIGQKRVGMIRAAWEEQREVRNVMLFLQGSDVSPGYAVKIYRHYGKDSIRIVKENPFRLAMDIFGIGFTIADGIAKKVGIPHDSPLRIEAGILHVLRKLAEDGHVYYPYEGLVEECVKVLDVARDAVLEAFGRIAVDKRVVIEDLGDDELRANNKAVYLAEFHAAESGVALCMETLIASPAAELSGSRGDDLGRVEKELGIVLADRQREAVLSSMERKVMVITGGPGTGKTTIIRSICGIYRHHGRRVLLAAPTGRAAKRMTEATGQEAKTIHRLLEYSPQERGFRRSADNRLDADLIVIDEASMIDTVLMSHFLRAVPSRARLILVGDIDQLPSVGPGNVLRDIIDSGAVTTIRLNEIFRQSRGSRIIVNAHRVNQGEFPQLGEDEDADRDFFFFEIEDPARVLETVIELCRERIPRKFGLDPFLDIQVLVPMYRGVVGALNLNTELQRSLNGSDDELKKGERVFRKGDKVMQIRNNYDRDVYNGDIGRIDAIDRESQIIAVNFDGRRVEYDFADLDEIVLAYAVSIHKSQGSEYPAVVIPFLTQHFMLLQRNLLYTAITRGRKLVVIVGTRKALAIAIRNDTPRKRFTRLRSRLSGVQ